MLQINIPDKLTNKVNKFAEIASQTPEEYIVELIEERIEHNSAYQETTYLAKSKINKQRLDKAIKDIKEGKYESHGLIND
ncbi:hypothetical protein QUF74_09570 [Candidatus Halobeggiatoa sp. HSG11]|nr:hypothetical protein [Candidatus Halobeggiatoa sp. HSG11]